MDEKRRLKKPRVRTAGHHETGIGASREPLQADCWRLPTGLLPGRWVKRGSGKERTEVGGHAGFGEGLQMSGCLIPEKLPGWCPVGEGTNVQSSIWPGPPEVTDTYKVPGTQTKSLVRCGVYRMKSQDIDGPRAGSLQGSFSRGRLWQGCSGPSHISWGGATSWVLASCPSASPWRPGSPGSNQLGRDLGGNCVARILWDSAMGPCLTRKKICLA